MPSSSTKAEMPAGGQSPFSASVLQVGAEPQSGTVKLYAAALALCINCISHLVTNEALYSLLGIGISTISDYPNEYSDYSKYCHICFHVRGQDAVTLPESVTHGFPADYF